MSENGIVVSIGLTTLFPTHYFL